MPPALGARQMGLALAGLCVFGVGLRSAEAWTAPAAPRPTRDAAFAPIASASKATRPSRPLAKASAAPAPTTPPTSPKPAPAPIALRHIRKIALDPGHGGDNHGCIGHLGTREKSLTLELAQRFAERLRATTDAEVLLLRTDDRAIDLRERPRLANAAGADLLISVHGNFSADPTIRGVEVWFLTARSGLEAGVEAALRADGVPASAKEDARVVGVAAVVHDLAVAAAHERSEFFARSLANALRAPNIPMPVRGVRQDAFGVLKEAQMPAVVLEVGYLSHPAENKLLLEPSTGTALADALRRAIVALDTELAQAEGGSRSSKDATSASASASSASASAPPSSQSSGSPAPSRKVPQRRPRR